jgi:hypothetical protein
MVVIFVSWMGCRVVIHCCGWVVRCYGLAVEIVDEYYLAADLIAIWLRFRRDVKNTSVAFRNAIFRGNVATESSCFAQLLRNTFRIG